MTRLASSLIREGLERIANPVGSESEFVREEPRTHRRSRVENNPAAKTTDEIAPPYPGGAFRCHRKPKPERNHTPWPSFSK